jgi:hypothetical protein
MSAALRAAFAAAANGVLGDKRCAPYYRTTTRPGDAWVSFARRDRDDTGFGYMDSWEIRVALSQDLATAEAWVDEHSDDLADAIATELVVTAVVMVTLVTDTGNTPGLIIEGVRPHDKEGA